MRSYCTRNVDRIENQKHKALILTIYPSSVHSIGKANIAKVFICCQIIEPNTKYSCSLYVITNAFQQCIIIGYKMRSNTLTPVKYASCRKNCLICKQNKNIRIQIIISIISELNDCYPEMIIWIIRVSINFIAKMFVCFIFLVFWFAIF